MEQKKYNEEYGKQCVKFVEHIKAHKEVQEAPVNPGQVMCKVCNKTFNEIIEENDNWNAADALSKWGGFWGIQPICIKGVVDIFKRYNKEVKEDVRKEVCYDLASREHTNNVLTNRAGDL